MCVFLLRSSAYGACAGRPGWEITSAPLCSGLTPFPCLLAREWAPTSPRSTRVINNSPRAQSRSHTQSTSTSACRVRHTNLYIIPHSALPWTSEVFGLRGGSVGIALGNVIHSLSLQYESLERWEDDVVESHWLPRLLLKSCQVQELSWQKVGHLALHHHLLHWPKWLFVLHLLCLFLACVIYFYL